MRLQRPLAYLPFFSFRALSRSQKRCFTQFCCLLPLLLPQRINRAVRPDAERSDWVIFFRWQPLLLFFYLPPLLGPSNEDRLAFFSLLFFGAFTFFNLGYAFQFPSVSLSARRPHELSFFPLLFRAGHHFELSELLLDPFSFFRPCPFFFFRLPQQSRSSPFFLPFVLYASIPLFSIMRGLISSSPSNLIYGPGEDRA